MPVQLYPLIVTLLCLAACKHDAPAPLPRVPAHVLETDSRQLPTAASPAASATAQDRTDTAADTATAARSKHETEKSGEPVAERQPADECVVVLSIEVRESEKLRTLRVHARNLSDEEMSFEVPERCPNGLIDFEGLGAGYDYYGTCASGACQGWKPARRISLGPRRMQLLAEAHVRVDGKPPCTQALAPGRYVVRPIAPSTSVAICVEEVSIEVPPPRSPDDQAVSDDPYWCRDASDCVLSCPGAPGCCGFPCGCRHAINVRHREAFESNYPKTCSRQPCPAVACAYQPADFATCRNNRCVGTTMSGRF